MAITDLTNTKWYFNEHPTLMSYKTYYINFYTKERGNCDDISIMSYEIDYSGSIVYESNEWGYEEDRTIEITGGVDVTNADLITWITSNATQIIEEPTPPTKIKSPVIVIKQKVKQVIVDNANMTIDIYTKEVPATEATVTITNTSTSVRGVYYFKQDIDTEYIIDTNSSITLNVPIGTEIDVTAYREDVIVPNIRNVLITGDITENDIYYVINGNGTISFEPYDDD